MIPGIDLSEVAFAAPAYLWLLVVPAALLLLGLWRLSVRAAETRRLAHRRTVPVRERFALVGDFPFWLFLIAAAACLIIALARPYGSIAAVRRGGVDLVILQDGSASMYVTDVEGDRWQRSMRFLRLLGDTLAWTDDRLALAVFARIATPQIRLTKDPNTFFFFLDHLDKRSPFRIEDDTTWDTNLELGIHWGLRLLDRDKDINGESKNAKVFVMISDGESWSGAVENALKSAVSAGVPLFVVGVGTTSGGLLPTVIGEDGNPISDAPVQSVSRLARASLARIATAGNGQYFELDRDPDRSIATSIIDAGRRLAPSLGVVERRDELYWPFLCLAGGLIVLGLPFLRDRLEPWIPLAAGAAALLTISRFL